MMSPQLLQRATHVFRKGYDAGYSGKTYSNPHKKGLFAYYDYEQGYKAGEADRKYAKRSYE